MATLVHLWNEWGLHFLVLLSFTLQVTLLVLAELRRRIDSGLLRLFVWSAYTMADSIAIYAIGHLAVTSQAAEHQVMALWAPLLLVHLGGQDNITAYAIEDNRLWLRHLQTLAVQAAGAAYVLYVSLAMDAGVGSHRPWLRHAAILLFLVGVAKYGERVWAMMHADYTPISSYGVAQRINSSTDRIRRSRTADTEVSETDTEGMWQVAICMLGIAKEVLKGPQPSLLVIEHYKPPMGGDVMRKVVEMQLSLLHDVFYTKADVAYRWYGLCTRVFYLVATAVALSLFHLHQAGEQGSRRDVLVTYVLLAGAVVLEVVSTLRSMLSIWTWRSLEYCVRPGHARLLPLELSYCGFGVVVEAVRRWCFRRAWLCCHPRFCWSDTMGQLNVFQMCSSAAASPVGKMAKWIGVEDWWNMFANSHSTRVSPLIKDLLVRQVLKSVDISKYSSSHISNSRGRGALERWGSAHHAGPSSLSAATPWVRTLFEPKAWMAQTGWWSREEEKVVLESVGLEFDESILVWHCASDAYLYWYRSQLKTQGQRLRQEELEEDDLAKAIQALSNYMLFLLAARPYMLSPAPASRVGYATLCTDLIDDGYLCSAEELVRAHALPREYRPPVAGQEADRIGIVQRVYRSSAIRQGYDLCRCLIKRELQDAPASAGRMLDLIAQVWVEMLCYAGAHCGERSHAMQLSNGSELVTLAALLVRYCEEGYMSQHSTSDLP